MKKDTRRIGSGIIAFLILLLSLIQTGRAQTQTLRINEFMAINETTLLDEDLEYSDWIEIYNTTAGAVNLSGWTLTDDESEPEKWVFPEVSLEANGYLVVFASGKDRDNAGGAEIFYQ